ncbi:MAG: polysaccharide deacetylase family protein [Hyphomicrobiaceae bacterium]
MLHQVCPPSGEAFEPSRILQITPGFLDLAIRTVREEGFEIVSLDDAHARLQAGSGGGDGVRPFVCFTLDDGYRDNLVHALPVFQAHDVPFTVYIPDRYADGDGDLWWLVLEDVVRCTDTLSVVMDGVECEFATGTLDEKHEAHHRIYWWLRGLDEDTARNVVRELADHHGVDGKAIAGALLMSWDEIRLLNDDPLTTIGAHTSGHYAMAKLSDERMHREVAINLDRLETELGERPAHFSYPYGCEASAGPREFAHLASLGLKTAVTTRKGMVFPDHGAHLTALPRFSLNGDYQDSRYLKVLLSGAPFLLWNRGRRLNVA